MCADKSKTSATLAAISLEQVTLGMVEIIGSFKVNPPLEVDFNFVQEVMGILTVNNHLMNKEQQLKSH